MIYPKELKEYENQINAIAKYKSEMGCRGIQEILDETRKILDECYQKISNIENKVNLTVEPEEFEQIINDSKDIENFDINEKTYIDKLKGGLFGRFAGCALGAPVEFATMEQMQLLSSILESQFPPNDYWLEAPTAYLPRYKIGFAKEFTRYSMKYLPVDDDITYTFISMLVMEKYGINFTTEQVGRIWENYLPLECTFTAENVVLNNLKNNMRLPLATVHKNPYLNMIGGLIRCDGYAYVSPMNPKKATYLTYKDCFLTHRNSGLYSAMYFSAVISLAFGDYSLREIFEIALSYIPKYSQFYKTATWALSKTSLIKSYKEATEAVRIKFKGMDIVHSENNSALIIFGCFIGEKDFEKGITHTVAMGFDNDCTGATVGSILGVFHGVNNVPNHWYENWNNIAKSYLNGIDAFNLQDVVYRFNNIRKEEK